MHQQSFVQGFTAYMRIMMARVSNMRKCRNVDKR